MWWWWFYNYKLWKRSTFKKRKWNIKLRIFILNFTLTQHRHQVYFTRIIFHLLVFPYKKMTLILILNIFSYVHCWVCTKYMKKHCDNIKQLIRMKNFPFFFFCVYKNFFLLSLEIFFAYFHSQLYLFFILIILLSNIIWVWEKKNC